jgi:hypothetical protein
MSPPAAAGSPHGCYCTRVAVRLALAWPPPLTVPILLLPAACPPAISACRADSSLFYTGAVFRMVNVLDGILVAAGEPPECFMYPYSTAGSAGCLQLHASFCTRLPPRRSDGCLPVS